MRSGLVFLVIENKDELEILSQNIKNEEVLEYYFTDRYKLPAVFAINDNAIEGHLGVSAHKTLFTTLEEVKDWCRQTEKRHITFLSIDVYLHPEKYPEYFL